MDDLSETFEKIVLKIGDLLFGEVELMGDLFVAFSNNEKQFHTLNLFPVACLSPSLDLLADAFGDGFGF